jgi:hypothetical protein
VGWCDEAQCPICGKIFHPAVQHSLTDGHRNFVCSPHCSEDARKRNQKLLFDEEEKDIENEKYRKNSETIPMDSMRATKPILIFDKNGTFIKRAPSQKSASLLTGVPRSTVCKICNGMQDYCNGFSFRYEQEINKSTKRYKY